jgi:hypothetical protein
MAEDMVRKLQAIDSAILTDVVRQDQRSPLFEVTEWSVRRLSDKGVTNPDGLWLFRGDGYDKEGSRSWSVVLKILQRQDPEPPLSDLWHWKREFFVAQSGLLARLPGPVKAPRFYRAEETADGAWLWQEYVQTQRPGAAWGIAEYAFAARQLGQWNGACLTNQPMSAEPWLIRQHYHSWFSQANPEQDFHFPLNRQYIVGDTRTRYEQLWAERERFYRVLETLPQVFSHFDSQRRNLFIRKSHDEQEELVLIDWAFCGLGPLGAELYALVSTSTTLSEWPLSTVAELDAAAFEGYLDGLNKAGWSGDAKSVRLGYVTWVAVWWGVVFPSIAAECCALESRPQSLLAFGFAEEELYAHWLPLLSYALDCADEARALMEQPGLV